MAIVTNNNNLGTAIDNLYTGNGITTKFFTVTVKDSSNTAMDLRLHDSAAGTTAPDGSVLIPAGSFHKDGLVDRILQKCQMRGTVVYFNVKNAGTGVITVGMEGEFATAANLATEFDNNSLSVKYRNTASSTTEDGVADIQGTTVAADILV